MNRRKLTKKDLAAELLRRGRHNPECSGLRNFERECDCGWYEMKDELRKIVEATP